MNIAEFKERERNNWVSAAEGWRRRDEILRKGSAPVTKRMAALGYLPGFDFQVYAFLLLQITDHREQVARLGIPFWPEHAHETLARLFEDPGQLLEPDRRVDKIAQHRPAGIDIAGKQALNAFLQQGLAKRGITLRARLNGFFEIFSQGHHYTSCRFRRL